MPMQRTTPQQLRDRIAAEFVTLFEGADPRMRRSVEGVLGRVQVLASTAMLGAIEWASKQMHVATADKDELPVRAAIWDVTPRDPVASRGFVTFAGAAGAVVEAGAELRRADDARYLTVADCELGDDGGTAEVVAVVTGPEQDTPAGSTLTLIEPVAGAQTAATVAEGGVAGGLGVEDVESLRARARERINLPPHGGAEHDYATWVQDVVGETRVWVKPVTPNVGAVTVFFLMPDGSIPSPATVTAVAAHIEEERPVTAHSAIPAAPVEDLIDFTIGLTPDTAANRAAVAAELADMLIREAEPGGTIPVSRYRAAISAAPGEYSHTITAPAGDIASVAGHIARLGEITWL